MAAASGLIFFASIVLHELAHSVVAKRQGIEVKAITLFIFGGVSQIASDARRPLHEFFIAIVGPLMSLVLAGVFFAIFFVGGFSDSEPLAIVLQWLIFMNLVVAAFNMAPGFPMDGGRVLRSALWGLTGNLLKATRLATTTGRAMGYSMMFIGGMAIFGVITFLDSWSGLWLGVLGMFLESSARQSWFQARALDLLSKYRAEEIMTPELETAYRGERVQFLVNRGGGRHFIFFVSDEDDRVIGLVTEKETRALQAEGRMGVAAESVMLLPAQATTAGPNDDGASMLQTMEAASVWHLPVLDDGRVVGVVSKENLLRLLGQHLAPGRRAVRGG
jgi:Zn-dependent protease/CBS domain-containing protein